MIVTEEQILKTTKVIVTKKGIKQGISEKSKVKGKVCKNFLTEDLAKYSKQLGITYPSGTKKEDICNLIELKLRQLDDTDPDKKWFYNAHEAIELK